jgi:integrase
MTESTNSKPSLADVQAALRTNTTIRPSKRRRIDNALNSVWRYTGQSLRDIPATMPALTQVMRGIEPAAHGVKRATIINMRNLVMHGMKQSGLVPELAHYREHHNPLSPSWSIFMSRVESQHEKITFWSFAHYLSDKKLAPSEVNDIHFQAWIKHLEDTSARANKHTLTRTTGRYWNDMRTRCPDLQLQEISTPPSRLRRLPHAIADFPQSFQDDLKRYRSWLTGEDIFADDARLRPVSESTAGNYLRKIHRAVSTLVDSGMPIRDVTGLNVLVELKTFKRIILALKEVDKSAQKNETFQTLVLLIQLAKSWLNVDKQHIDELLQSMKRAQVKKPRMEMTDKNTKLVTQFDDPATFMRLFNAPAALWKRAVSDTKLSDRTRLAKAQAAIGLAILPNMPLRLVNLTDLTFGDTIILRPNGTSSIIIPKEVTKSRRPIEFDVPEDVAAMLIEYYEDIAPAMLGRHPEKLFCRTDGVGKGFAQVRYLIQSYFKEYVGFHMNPHAFRHLCAKLILDNDPGAHTVVQELLGHKSVETSTAFYAGLSSRRAGRHHHALIMKTIEREAQAPVLRRRRRKWS